MSQQYFLTQLASQPSTEPSERWRQAFPDGQVMDGDVARMALRPADTVWVPVAHVNWEGKVKALQVHQPQCRVVVASMAPDEVEGLRALEVGARGYCHALAVPELLREVAQVVSHGGLWVGPELVGRLMAATREALERSPHAVVPLVDLSSLSEREAQVAQAVASGKSNKEVAEQLHISERTVKAHLGAVFEKLGLRDRVQLVLHLQRTNATAP